MISQTAFMHRLLAILPALLLTALALSADTNKPAAKPAEEKFHAILVWATDDDKPAEKEEELKAVEPALKEKFKFLKWKNYFQVGERKHVAIRPNETKEIQLSHKCKLKLHQTEKEGLQVELIGEGTPVIKKNQTMPLKDILIIGGDDKNATAWMVVLKPD
jgi:hypothetical protein